MDPDPAIFVIDLLDANKKLIFFTNFFCLLLFEGRFTSFFKDKKIQKSHKTVRVKVFLLFLFDYRGIRIREAQKRMDPVDPDPDPEHCCQILSALRIDERVAGRVWWPGTCASRQKRACG
jgi:hypothetical protein